MKSTNPKIGKQPMSFVRLVSKAARWYSGGSFKIRGVTYEMMRDGSLRAHGKPRSRVKRLREQRSESSSPVEVVSV
jgi:hypothetical protein